MQPSQPALMSMAFAALAVAFDALFVVATGWQGLTRDPSLRAVFRVAMDLPCMVAHVSLTTLLLVAWRRMRVRFAHAPGIALTLALMVFAGALGSLLGLLAALLRCLLPPTSTPAAPLDTARDRAAPTRIALAASEAQKPQALCDVFRHGTLAQRRRAVALMGSHFKPQFAEALRMALRDENNAIRVQAGMALLQLEDEYGRLQSSIEGRGEDSVLASHGFGTDKTCLELAQLHDQQAYSGLLDDDRTRTAQLQALRAYRDHLTANPGDDEAMAAVGRLLVRADQHELVADWFGEQVQQGHASGAILLWLAEALYRSRRYPELQALLREHRSRIAAHLPADSPLRAVVQLWQAAERGGADAPSG